MSATICNRPKHPLNKRRLFADLGYSPHPGQWEVHNSTAPRRIVACGVRWGKTKCSAMEAVAAMLEPRQRSMGWVVAPTYDLADRVFREIQIVLYEHLRHRIVLMKEHERRIVIVNMAGGHSEVRAKSADNPVSLLGEGLDWLIADEASRLKPHIWESHLSQRLIDKRGWALLISTPRGKGYFHQLYMLGQGKDPDYQSWNLPTWTNPLLDAGLIERQREHVPESVFLQEYGAQFVEGAGAVFRNVRECATGELEGPLPGERYVAGLDLAKVEDYTVLVILDSKRRVVFFDRFHRVDWGLQAVRVKAACDRYRRARVLTDATGVGDPVIEQLHREGVYAQPFIFTKKSKSDIVNNLALQFEKGRLTLPRPELWPEGIDELEAFEYSVTDSGNVTASAPSGGHDDCVMALALAAWQLRREGPAVRFGRL